MTPTDTDSTTEPVTEQVDRVAQMADGFGEWDLSDNDMEALRTVLRHRSTLLTALKALVAAVEARDNSIDCGVSSHAEVMSNARHYIQKAEGR